jgi:hypothetical protein
MSQPLYQPPVPQPPARPATRRWPWIAGIVGALILGIVLGAAAAGTRSDTATTGSASTSAVSLKPGAVYIPPEPTTTVPTPTVVLPKPSDFTVDVKILEKKCFGSAGCNITYQIDPKYIGTTPLSSSKEITVVYEVAGGEDPQINRFTINGDTASYPKEELIQTKSSKAQLTAKVTQVF